MYYHKEPKRSDCCDNNQLSMFYRYMETNDVKGSSYEQKHNGSMPIVGIVPKDFHDCLRVPNCVNYDISNMNCSTEDLCPFSVVYATNVIPCSNMTFEQEPQLLSSGEKLNAKCGEKFHLLLKNLLVVWKMKMRFFT